MSAVRLKIINLSENTAKSSDKDWLPSQIPGAHLKGEHGENLLGAAERENGDEHAAITLAYGINGFGEPVHLRLPRKPGRDLFIAASGFHNQNIGLNILEAGGFKNCLIVKTNIAGVEEALVITADQDSG